MFISLLVVVEVLWKSYKTKKVNVNSPFSSNGVRVLLISCELSGGKEFPPERIIDLFLKDWDESMSVDGTKTLPDVEF